METNGKNRWESISSSPGHIKLLNILAAFRKLAKTSRSRREILITDVEEEVPS